MSGEYFKSNDEMSDLTQFLREERKNGAQSGGIFGSRLTPGRWTKTSDIDVVVNDNTAPALGVIEHVEGKKSGTWLHVFRKRPGLSGGKSRREEILDDAERDGRFFFWNKKKYN